MGEKISDKMKFHIKTYGCQMNERDSEKVYCIFKEYGFEEASIQDADVVVVNSCAVREKAESKIYSEIGRIKSINKKAKIIAMGCVAQFNHKKLKTVSDFVVGTSSIDKFYRIVKNIEDGVVFVDEKMDNPDYIFPHKKGLNAFVDIMYGCNNFCTYCIVPFTRGREISRTKESIIDEVKQLVDNGTKEVMLLGQNVNSYGHKLGYGFVDLLYEVDKIGGLERVRFTTSHPKDFSKELIYAMKELKTVCEHIHLPLQSGSNKILKLMRRGYTKEEYLEKVYLYKEQIAEGSITTDIIVGFPQETEEDFQETLEIVKNVEYDTSFSFKYSKRPLTKAREIEPQVDEDVKLRRLNELQDLQAEITQRKNKEQIGKVFDVLVEGKSKKGNMLYGRNRQNTVVNFDFKDNINARGDVVKVKITKALKHSLVGELV